jgi:hypothetical protein
MRTLAMAALAVFALAALGQGVAEATLALPIAPARMLVATLGVIAAAPVGIWLIEAGRGRRLGAPARVAAAACGGFLAVAGLQVATRVAGGPLGPIPGGALRGVRVADPRPDWRVLDTTRYVQLETHGPRSVELIVVRSGDDAFVGANFPEWKRWPSIVERHPRVVLRVGDRLYERWAVPIDDVQTAAALLAAMSVKYGFDVSMGTGVVRFFRLDPPHPSRVGSL